MIDFTQEFSLRYKNKKTSNNTFLTTNTTINTQKNSVIKKSLLKKVEAFQNPNFKLSFEKFRNSYDVYYLILNVSKMTHFETQEKGSYQFKQTIVATEFLNHQLNSFDDLLNILGLELIYLDNNHKSKLKI